MRDAPLLRRPSDLDEQMDSILRGAVRSRRHAFATRGRECRTQAAGDQGVHLSLAGALALPAGRLRHEPRAAARRDVAVRQDPRVRAQDVQALRPRRVPTPCVLGGRDRGGPHAIRDARHYRHGYVPFFFCVSASVSHLCVG